MKLFDSIDKFLGSLPRWSIVIIATVILAIVGFVDYITGAEIGFSIFYVIPVMLLAWYLGRVAGIVASFVAAVTWYVADVGTDRIYSTGAIPIWNAVVRLAFFLLVAFLLYVVKSVLEQEQDLARTDSLTGVLNTRQFYRLAEGEIDRARRYNRPLSIAYIDLDNFKEVNDVYGHSAGDELLRFVAGTIIENSRASDIVARMGGDEFIVLLPESDEEGAAIFMKRLRWLIMEGMPEYRFPVTLSVGLITYLDPPVSVEEMIHEVDTLMYYVKNSTKNAIKHEVVREEGDRERIVKLRPGHESDKGAGIALR
jgi:diguanylate cyclase (GGDEF)-like protein